MTLVLQGSGVMAPEWSLDTAAGGCDAAGSAAVSRHQSRGRALRIHPESRVGLSSLWGTLEGSGFRPAFPS